MGDPNGDETISREPSSRAHNCGRPLGRTWQIGTYKALLYTISLRCKTGISRMPASRPHALALVPLAVVPGTIRACEDQGSCGDERSACTLSSSAGAVSGGSGEPSSALVHNS